MTAIYVIRHPQTTWNVASRYQGRLDAPLSDDGRRQVQPTAAVFRASSVAAVYTSPLSRAAHLAEAVARAAACPCIVDPRLSEIAMGPWEGLERSVIERRYPELYHEWDVRPDQVQFPHGETIFDVMARAASVVSDVFERHTNEDVCLVTHSAVVQAILLPSLGMEPRYMHRLKVKNASITTLCGTEPPGLLQTFNAVDHLYGTAVESAVALGCATVERRRKAS